MWILGAVQVDFLFSLKGLSMSKLIYWTFLYSAAQELIFLTVQKEEGLTHILYFIYINLWALGVGKKVATDDGEVCV